MPPCESDLGPAEGAVASQMGFLCQLESAVISEASHRDAKGGPGFHLFSLPANDTTQIAAT